MEARPKNWLVPVTLVLLRQWSSYGYELMERAVELGFEAINPGTVYRTLRRWRKTVCANPIGKPPPRPEGRHVGCTPSPMPEGHI